MSHPNECKGRGRHSITTVSALEALQCIVAERSKGLERVAFLQRILKEIDMRHPLLTCRILIWMARENIEIAQGQCLTLHEIEAVQYLCLLALNDVSPARVCP